MARIVVSGYMVRYPLAGMALAYLHPILGLRRLGHEVAYLEESGWTRSCFDPVQRKMGDDPTMGLARVRSFFDHIGLDCDVFYVNRESGQVHGGDWKEVKRILREADLLINFGGACWLSEFRLATRLAFVDIDPLFTQTGHLGAESIDRHDIHFTYGVNVGSPGCSVPTGDIEWRGCAPAVVPDLWEKHVLTEPETQHPFTTVANWAAYGSIVYEGLHFGQKDEQFVQLLNLPGLTPQPLELALAGADPGTWQTLQSAGWSLRDAVELSVDLPRYQAYIGASRGELSVAKQGYVKTRSGWFSDRSACYLAAGRPVILQETGFSDWLPVGQGLLSFSDLDEAVICLEQVNANYRSHCRAAARIAEERLSFSAVIPPMLDVALRRGGLSVSQPGHASNDRDSRESKEYPGD